MSSGDDSDYSLPAPPPDDKHRHNEHSGDLSTIGPEVVGVCWMLVALALVFLATRLYAKFSARRGMWWDDHVLLASWLMLVAYVITTTLSVTRGGLGTHDGSGLNDLPTIQFLTSVSTVFSCLGAAWSKTSFAITLLRVTDGFVKLGIWAIIVTLNITMAFNAILPFIWCDPPIKGWTPFVRGTCWDRHVVIQCMMYGAAYSAAMDFILAIIPWAVIMKLNMALKEKLGVVVCMSLAVVAGVTSIVRCVNVHLLYEEDFPYESGKLAMWTAAEMSVTIIAASIPVLRILIRNIVTHRSYSQYGTDGPFYGGTHTSVVTSSKRGFKNNGSGSGDDADSIASLARPRHNSIHIFKSETVTIDYERRSVSQVNGLGHFGFEMAHVTPQRHNSRNKY
ncbi:uncharacterized protein JN550_007712 [Neoarthrinium moseri]|uniref:uncharacterized protein n=1 Tax=Neoarthrinium moseri TaxID=1658444 RepID=UPI001FDCE20E|nr:uncharacterized protein JN550_007712 [Neoarthrinium moseri]KAI1866324.1 hypothetical protein JN550_007712 [Neoarthrinium moseri]